MKRIKSKRGVVKRYNAILRKFYKEHPGGTYGWDMPTLSLCFPHVALKIRILKRLYGMLPE